MFSENFKEKIPKIFIFSFIIIAGIIIIFLIVDLSFYRFIADDEFEHLHASFLVSKEQIPYRDFFEHHTPFLWYLLAPIFLLSNNPLIVITLSRIMILLMVLLIFYFIYKITKEIFNKESAIFAIFGLSITLLYIQSIIEIRPDVPMILFWLISWLYFLKAVKNNSFKHYIYSGLSLSIAFLFKQTIILFFLSYLIILFFKRKSLLFKSILSFIFSFIIPQVIIFTIFYFLGGAKEYLELNFLWNFKINNGFYYPFFEAPKNYLFYDWPSYLLGIGGIFLVIKEWIIRKNISTGKLSVIILIIISAFFLIFTINSPYAQYWLPILIILAMFMGYLLNYLIFNTEKRYLFKIIIFYLIFLFIINNAFLGLSYINLFKKKSQIEKINLILDITAPNQKIFDSVGEYIFRPHANYYWFLTDNMLSARDQNKLKIDLSDYLQKADIVILNYRLINLKNEFTDLLMRDFRRYQNTNIYLKRNLNVF